jgi:membrane associated rhomboid family serine protease
MGVAEVCPYCGANNRATTLWMRRVLGRATDRTPAAGVSVWIAGLNVFLFLTAIAVGGAESGRGFDVLSPSIEVLFRLGLQSTEAIDAGQWWRVVTPVFLHLGLFHLLMNCYLLYVAGRLLEEELGSRLMLLVYLASGILGFVASYVADLGGGGASGAVSGLLGALLVRRRLVDGHFRHPVTQWVIWLTVLNAVFGLSVAQVNNVAHLFGYLAGVGLAWLVTAVRIGRAGDRVLAGLAWGLVAVTAASLALMLLSLRHGGPGDLERALQCWSKTETVTFAFEPRAAETARGCLADLHDLEESATAAKHDAMDALARTLAADRTDDAVSFDRGLSDLGGAVNRFAVWLQEAAGRYGHGF